MATVRIELDKRYKTTDGTFPVKIRIFYDQSNRRYATEFKFSPEEWNSIKKDTCKSDKLKEEKSKVDRLRIHIEGILKKLGSNFTIEEFERLYLGKIVTNEKDFIEYSYRSVMYELEKQGRISTHDDYRTSMNSILGFKPHLKCSEITPEFLKDYERWMLSKGKSITSVGVYLRGLKVMVNYAIENGFMSREKYPFGKTTVKKYKVPKGKSNKRALHPDVIKKIRKFKAGGKVNFFKDMWLFCFFTGGMNVIDLMLLKHENIQGDFIVYTRRKIALTAPDAEPIKIYITKDIRELFERHANKKVSDNTFLFPTGVNAKDDARQINNKKDAFNKELNRTIECIGYTIGVKERISYMHARHSYATVMKNAGQPIEMISESMGHQSVKTTRNYLSGFYDEHLIKSASAVSKAVAV